MIEFGSGGVRMAEEFILDEFNVKAEIQIIKLAIFQIRRLRF